MSTLWHLNPLVFLFVAFLTVLTVAFFWPGNGDNRGAAQGRRPGPSWNVPPGRSPRVPEDRERWGVRELESKCGADYATRFAEAIRRVRVF